jgi:hypothetical protein
VQTHHHPHRLASERGGGWALNRSVGKRAKGVVLHVVVRKACIGEVLAIRWMVAHALEVKIILNLNFRIQRYSLCAKLGVKSFSPFTHSSVTPASKPMGSNGDDDSFILM